VDALLVQIGDLPARGPADGARRRLRLESRMRWGTAKRRYFSMCFDSRTSRGKVLKIGKLKLFRENERARSRQAAGSETEQAKAEC